MNSNIENDYDQCFIVNHLKEECRKKSFSRKTGMILLQDVSEKDRALLEWRYEVKISESDLNKDICYHHEKMYLTRYVGLQKYCCDPYNTHGDHFITSKWKKYLLDFFEFECKRCFLNYNVIRIFFLYRYI